MAGGNLLDRASAGATTGVAGLAQLHDKMANAFDQKSSQLDTIMEQKQIEGDALEDMFKARAQAQEAQGLARLKMQRSQELSKLAYMKSQFDAQSDQHQMASKQALEAAKNGPQHPPLPSAQSPNMRKPEATVAGGIPSQVNQVLQAKGGASAQQQLPALTGGQGPAQGGTQGGPQAPGGPGGPGGPNMPPVPNAPPFLMAMNQQTKPYEYYPGQTAPVTSTETQIRPNQITAGEAAQLRQQQAEFVASYNLQKSDNLTRQFLEASKNYAPGDVQTMMGYLKNNQLPPKEVMAGMTSMAQRQAQEEHARTGIMSFQAETERRRQIAEQNLSENQITINNRRMTLEETSEGHRMVQFYNELAYKYTGLGADITLKNNAMQLEAKMQAYEIASREYTLSQSLDAQAKMQKADHEWQQAMEQMRETFQEKMKTMDIKEQDRVNTLNILQRQAEAHQQHTEFEEQRVDANKRLDVIEQGQGIQARGQELKALGEEERNANIQARDEGLLAERKNMDSFEQQMAVQRMGLEGRRVAAVEGQLEVSRQNAVTNTIKTLAQVGKLDWNTMNLGQQMGFDKEAQKQTASIALNSQRLTGASIFGGTKRLDTNGDPAVFLWGVAGPAASVNGVVVGVDKNGQEVPVDQREFIRNMAIASGDAPGDAAKAQAQLRSWNLAEGQGASFGPKRTGVTSAFSRQLFDTYQNVTKQSPLLQDAIQGTGNAPPKPVAAPPPAGQPVTQNQPPPAPGGRETAQQGQQSYKDLIEQTLRFLA